MHTWLLHTVKYTKILLFYMCIKRSGNDNNVHAFLNSTSPVWVWYSLTAVGMKDLRRISHTVAVKYTTQRPHSFLYFLFFIH